MTIPDYPQSAELHMLMRPLLHPMFQKLPDGISELTFANLYLFRESHNYRISRVQNDIIIIIGDDDDNAFFILPFKLPDCDMLEELFQNHSAMKCVSESQMKILQKMRYEVFVEGKPVAYSLGEDLAGGESFVIHFEKASSDYKGLWQFVNQAFASILTDKYSTINREQDLGNQGMRQAKMSYKPFGFVKKYRVFPTKN